MQSRFKIFYFMIGAGLCFSFSLFAQESERLRKITDDIENKYTSVGNIGITITNYGTFGTRNNFWPSRPSCEYPRGSRVEHIYQGALWVGAQIKTKDSTDPRNGMILVSTGASDRTTRSSTQHVVEGYEFNSELGDSITEMSTLTYDRPPASQFYPGAISHQDFICDYTDKKTRVPSSGDTITNHIPLGLKIHQESYAWNFPYVDYFVILRYTIQNASSDTLDSVYVGLWNNAVVRNTNLVRPGTPGYFDYTGQGYDSTQRLAYSFDFSGTPGGPPADSYIGLKLLGSTPFPSTMKSLDSLCAYTYYNAWQYRLETGQDEYKSPQYDYTTDRYLSRYSRLTSSMPRSAIDPLRASPRNVTYLLSMGPFSRLNPGNSVEVVYAVVCAKKFGSAPANNDTKEQKKILYKNVGWAQQAYNGEDVNCNDSLDAGEDNVTRDSLGLRYQPDGKITRYLLPTPPNKPKVHMEVSNQSVAIYWDKSSEESIDPMSGVKDFEGYRIYRSNTGADFQNNEEFMLNLSLVGEFDKIDSIGYDTGLERVLLDSPKSFPGDTTKYWYRFPPESDQIKHLNGWQYIYGVSAFDKGDSANGIPSNESAISVQRVIAGTPPVANKSTPIGVYPNPYYVNAYWDGPRERLRKIYFYNLFPQCEIRIYTLAGDVVAVIEHDAETYKGEGIEWFNQYGDRLTQPQFAGGEHAWDLITRYDQAIATGLYLFTVEDRMTGNVKRGKFMIIK